MRVVLALLSAALTAAAIFFVPEFVDQARHLHGSEITSAFHAALVTAFFAFSIALAHAIFLGLPVFAALKGLNLTFWWISLICGFLIGLVPFAIFSWPARSNYTYQAYDGERMVDYVINGVPTHAGWVQYAEAALGMGLIGMLSGLAAWLTWRFVPYADASRAQ